MQEQKSTEATVLQTIIAGLEPLDDVARVRLLETVARFFDLPSTGRAPSRAQLVSSADHYGERKSASEDITATETPSPKAFLVEKAPRTLVERVACLAFYLTHFRSTPHFKTLDISKINTEAAQTKFSNTAQSVADTTRAGLLAAAGKGSKQLSAVGEEYVKALPDYDAARDALKRLKPAKARKKPPSAKKRGA